MEKKIKSLTVTDDHDSDNTYTVGVYGVVKIEEHSAQGEGDKWYYDIFRENGEITRHFVFKSVTYTT